MTVDLKDIPPVPTWDDAGATIDMEPFDGVLSNVLEHWGIHETGDVGDVVFALVESGILIKQDEDTRAEFENVYDFDEAFQTSYPRIRRTGT